MNDETKGYSNKTVENAENSQISDPEIIVIELINRFIIGKNLRFREKLAKLISNGGEDLQLLQQIVLELLNTLDYLLKQLSIFKMHLQLEARKRKRFVINATHG